MPQHPDSAVFVEYVDSTYRKIFPAMEETGWKFFEQGGLVPDTAKNFTAQVFVLLVTFAAIDGNITDSEAAFITDVYSAISPDTDWTTRPLSELKGFYEQTAKTNIDIGLDVPMALILLQHYDDAKGTDHATSLKDLFYRLALGIVRADGQVSPLEQSKVDSYKETLFGYTRN